MLPLSFRELVGLSVGGGFVVDLPLSRYRKTPDGDLKVTGPDIGRWTSGSYAFTGPLFKCRETPAGDTARPVLLPRITTVDSGSERSIIKMSLLHSGQELFPYDVIHGRMQL